MKNISIWAKHVAQQLIVLLEENSGCL